jgi:DNA-binding XRE family transcriptional regulator
MRSVHGILQSSRRQSRDAENIAPLFVAVRTLPNGSEPEKLNTLSFLGCPVRQAHSLIAIVSKSTTGKPLIARLRELRKRHSISQEQCSELTGISYKYYQMIEGGRRIDLRLSTLQKLAAGYGIQIHELLSPEMPETQVPKAIPSKHRGRPRAGAK